MVTRPSLPDFDEYIEEIRGLWDSRWLTNMGEKHKQFQKELTEYLDAEHVELMVNGHMALELTLQAMKLQGEVITTPFTFASTAHAIVRNGLVPVFCDIRSDDYTIDVDKIEELITEKTSAIVPVHVYGNLCDVDKIQQIADRYGLKVIYDAAHSFGMKYKGLGVGNFGDASCFSFHATKVFHTIEGGAVSFHDARLGADLCRLKNFGIRDPETVDGIGANAKMNEFCAAMGICNLRHIDREIAKRGSVSKRYRKNLSEVPGVKLNAIQSDATSNYAYFPVLFDETVFGADRDAVFEALMRSGIGVRKYFYPLANTYDCYKERYDAADTPVAKYISERVLTLPLYADLMMEDVDRICEVIVSCKR